MKLIITFNNKNVILPEPYIPPYTALPLGMKVYDGDINVYFEYSPSNTTTIYYAINNTSNWNILGNSTITVLNGETIYFYGPLNNPLNDGESTRGFHTSGTGKIDLVGNLLSLCNPNWTNAINITSNFASMFRECKNNLYNANNSYIRTNSITTNIEAGWGYLFLDCNYLKTPINWICENNSLTVSGSAAIFIGMYVRCTSLETVIIPPIINALSRVFERYIDGCTALNKMYYNGTVSINYTNFSRNIPETGDFYNLGGATYATGTSGIPSGWTIHTSL